LPFTGVGIEGFCERKSFTVNFLAVGKTKDGEAPVVELSVFVLSILLTVNCD
jgi:hypothetical protein